MSATYVTRRSVLGGAAATGGLIAAGIASSVSLPGPNGRIVVLTDSRISLAERRSFSDGLAGGPYAFENLAMELVRQWRDGLQERFEAEGSARFLTRWDHAVLLRGLLRESRAAVQSLRGQGTLHLTIARMPDLPRSRAADEGR